MLQAIFADLNGRPLQMRLDAQQLSSALKPGFCHTVLLHSPTGNTVRVRGYGEDSGHENAYLNLSEVTMRSHWRSGELAIATITDADGSPHPLCSRTLLQTANAALTSYDVDAQVGIEIEFYLLNPEHVSYLHSAVEIPRQYFGPVLSPRIERVIDKVIDAANKAGVKIASFSREINGLQYEFSLAPQSSLDSADDVLIFREIVRNISIQNGLLACFMAQVFDGSIGNGLHINLSLSPLHERPHPSDKDYLASALTTGLESSVFGHLGALCAIWNPTINSYRRLHHEKPRIKQATSTETRDGIIRLVHLDGRIQRVELRLPDSLANPYTAIALSLRLLVESLSRNGVDSVIPDKPMFTEEGFAPLPASLKEAIQAFRNDTLVREGLSPEFIEVYSALKADEISAYETRVVDLDYRMYQSELAEGLVWGDLTGVTHAAPPANVCARCGTLEDRSTKANGA